jgi:hypothetical protein
MGKLTITIRHAIVDAPQVDVFLTMLLAEWKGGAVWIGRMLNSKIISAMLLHQRIDFTSPSGVFA